MHAHVHKEFFRNRDVSPSPRLFFSSASSPFPSSFPTGGGQCLGGGHISSTPGGGYWGWWQKILPSKNYPQCSGEASSPLSLSLFLSFSFFFFSFSSPSLRLATFLRFPALSSVPRGAGRREKRLSNPSSLGFQGLLLAAFNEKKDKTCPPPSFARIPCEIFRNWPRISINKNRVFSSDFSRRRIQVRRSFFKF